MGKRGPAPTPTTLKLLQGNPGRRPIPPHEPQPRRVKLACPRTLSATARRVWRRIAPELARLGLTTVLDREALIVFCEAFATFERAQQALNDEGLTVPTQRDGRKAHPAQKIAREAAQTIRQFAQEFGLTPSARARIAADGVAEFDDFEKWLQGASPDYDRTDSIMHGSH